MPYRSSFAVALIAAPAALLACSALLGVDDVSKEKEKKSLPDGGDPSGTSGGTNPGDDDDADPPDIDRGKMALGFNHGCLRSPDGSVKCWGDNGAGQLGDGLAYDDPTRLAQALTPQPVPGITDAIDIASGLSHTCVVHRAGNVSCWGVNFFGQLGDGTTERSSKPVAVPQLDDVTAIAGGQSFTCGIRRDKTVWCWGANYSGQLGDGTKDDRLAPTPVRNLANAIDVTGATDHGCAVVAGGEVLCWGGNSEGQLGIGSQVESLVATRVTALSGVAQIAAAARFTCARETSGRVQCWGSNQFGQLGNGAPSAQPNPSPIIVPGIGDAVYLWTGFEHACAARRTGAVVCWGKADDGQIGNDTRPDASVTTPAGTLGLPGTVHRVWTGGNRSCAIADDGRAFCWGINSLGHLGNGTTDRALRAVPMTTP